MTKKPNLHEVKSLVSALESRDQLELVGTLVTQLKTQAVTEQRSADNKDLLLAEAEWISSEHAEFVKLIQSYKSLYVTATFAALAWALGQLLSSPPATIDTLRSRADIAALLSILPFINVLFATLMLEAHTHMTDLARYRFLLGLQLGYGEPPWRWNLWREKRKTSALRIPTTFLNLFSGFLFLLITGGALVFSRPALAQSEWLWWLWGPAVFIFVIFLITVGLVGLYWLKGAAIITKPPIKGEAWPDLWKPEEQKSVVQANSHEQNSK